MTLVSDIKLIRTDTTLDLSQKAEKASEIPATGANRNWRDCDNPNRRSPVVNLVDNEASVSASRSVVG
ncbi:hypothetical protein MPTK1_7g08030 [Marchantia polymorpha subsp. ruderalis]|uniref:Uncharacterized protein n=2 Tax=Marchantia polymorpha TaxID=3197 RepID=A0AAF6BX99_MARPO|nr:hypothetical protein MARPO_0146s0003 [Marchantia polymorpha]BBN16633.1 hypothetical protein Mp_7g08030 [Marchantia polymorpha subsp. ruderalis]|eukprot:PTQ29180.1 hypothetical protein MARPO_0146s0003 [Marchantia polymorpha]